MNTDDDQSWLDALAGRAHAAAEQAEAKLLRAALRARQADQTSAAARPAQPPAAAPARAEALIARARAAGVLEGPQGGSAPPSRLRRAWRPLLAAAAVICLALGVIWQLRLPGGVTTVRDAAAPLVRLEARDPAQLKQTLLTELRAAGVEAEGYESLGVQGIDADLPQPLPPRVRQVLAAHDIPEPRNGALRLEIREAR